MKEYEPLLPGPAAAAMLQLPEERLVEALTGRGLHSSTFQLNLSTFCWIRWLHEFPPVY